MEQDAEQALRYFEKGVELGDKLSQLLLGIMYEEGIVVERDWKAAIKLFQESALHGVAEAQYRLGKRPHCSHLCLPLSTPFLSPVNLTLT